MSEVIYLAGPFSHSDKNVMEFRADALAWFAGTLMNMGHIVYSPVNYGDRIVMLHDLPTSWEYWKKMSVTSMSVCTKLCVIQLPGWEKSTGVQDEIKIADALGIPVESINCETITTLEEVTSLVNMKDLICD